MALLFPTVEIFSSYFISKSLKKWGYIIKLKHKISSIFVGQICREPKNVDCNYQNGSQEVIYFTWTALSLKIKLDRMLLL
jgi:hypothetical protein